MYELGTVVVLGLVVYAVAAVIMAIVGAVGSPGIGWRSLRAVRASWLVLSLGLGVLLSWAINYSMFARWGIDFRGLWMGTVGTGLVMGGLAVAWQEVLGFIGSFAHRAEDQAAEIEGRTLHKVA